LAQVTHTVVKGDTLSKLAVRYGTTVSELVKLNDITDPDYIVVGQVLIISGGTTTTTTNTTNKAKIKAFGLQSNTDRTVYATWTWDKDKTENYKTMWYYATGDGVWFIGNDSTTTNKQSTYNAPTNATKVKFKVKPVAKSGTANGNSSAPWTADWSTEKTYKFSSNPPTKPPTPDVTIEGTQLTATLANLNVNGTSIEFQVVKNDDSVYTTGTASIITKAASYSCTVALGNKYKVRCRAIRGDLESDWSDYSANQSTTPSTPAQIIVCRANSETSVYLEWPACETADSYDVAYTSDADIIDYPNQYTTQSGITEAHHIQIGLSSGLEYFFRVRAVNANTGNSGWSSLASVILGTTPAAPTTWSSTNTAVKGEELTLYWVHNSEDGSSQTYGELEIDIDGEVSTYTYTNSTDEDEKDKTSFYNIDTNGFVEGATLKWRVRTAGITNVYGEWSVQRTVDIYAPATLEMSVANANGEAFETLEQFPFYIHALASPATQMPIGYQVNIVSNDTYDTVDNLGNDVVVGVGERVYSEYYDISESLNLEISASSVNLANNVSYTVTCTVTMNTGLTASASSDFTVAWTDEEYSPNAEISVDPETYCAHIRPYCENEYGVLIEGVTLSVYRREFDGGFTEIATNLANTSNTFVTDPHPALDYARYRIVAMTAETGAVSYYDIPGYPVGGKAIIIQWDEAWQSFDTTEDAVLERPTWSGSMIKLPYNIDISNRRSKDVEHVKYIGRKHPVAYYGTQLGESSTWSVVIDKEDVDTLYALRRLGSWAGDVYVREPSGSGYWASITVNDDHKHTDLTIPISIDVTRVEGGV
jgi:hypothetical protein